MKTIAGGLILAVLLFAAGALCQAESRHSKKLADAQLRLATLKLGDAGDLDDETTIIERLPAPIGLPPNTEDRHEATVSYWTARYTSLTDMTNAANGPAPSDAEMLLLAANAAYRTSAPQSEDKKGAVQRLDNVIQAYADVMRRDPSLSDAAYNYEYVTRLRDQIAKSTGKNAKAAAKKGPNEPPDVSVDLPTGPTIHGKPGGPPEGTAMSDFKTVTPMRYDEREEQMDPGLGKKLQRKG
jgi:hypothetical protein